MEMKRVRLPQPLRIVGFAAEVQKDQASATIGKLWQQAAQAGILPKAGAAYAVYFDYQDKLGERYRVLVGRASEATPGEDEQAVLVPDVPYYLVEGSGPPVEAAVAAWTRVWKDRELRTARSYGVDLEVVEGGAEGCRLSLYLS